MKIECHALQNFAPSCLNRDDTNTPKSCEFGGVRRARVSSQSWKRAVREFFRAEGSAPVGTRTKHLKERLVKALGMDATPEQVGVFVETVYSQMDGKRPDETAVLLFVSDGGGRPHPTGAGQAEKRLQAGQGGRRDAEGGPAFRRHRPVRADVGGAAGPKYGRCLPGSSRP